ncbi:MAG: type II toxin-antitoxin system VapC family toxin [Bacteroidota bacterium]|nr:type II toxin-antitoxin system VapC family toxin [Bacteroidota bacterium]
MFSGLASLQVYPEFRNEEGAEKVSQLLHNATNDKYELYMTCINAGEVFYITYRKENAAKAEIAWKAIQQFPIHIVETDMELALISAKLKARYSISYADAFAAALTIKRKGMLITGDKV